MKKVWIIEDDLAHQKSMQIYLPEHGYEVECMSSMDEAMGRIDNRSEGLMVIDYHLHDRNAGDLIEMFRVAGIKMPFLVVTANGNEEIAVQMMKAGAWDYIIKTGSYLPVLSEKIERSFERIDLEKKIKQSEIAVRKSEEKLRQIIRGTGDGIVISSTAGEIYEWNNAMEKMFGYSPDQAIGRNLADILYDLSEPQFKNSYKASDFKLEIELASAQINMLEIPWRQTSKIYLSDGLTKYIRISTTAIHLPEEDMLCSIITDLTDEKELTEKLKYRIDFESIINGISADLLNSIGGNIDSHLRGAMETVSNFLKTDAAIFRFIDTLGYVRSVNYSKEQYNDLTKNIADNYLKAFEREIFIDPDTHSMVVYANKPNDYGIPEYFFEKTGAQSILTIAVKIDKRVVGLLTFIDYTHNYQWYDEDIKFIRTLGQMFVSTKRRERYEEYLASELKINAALASISKNMIKSSSIEETWLTVLENSLKLTQSRLGFIALNEEDSGVPYVALVGYLDKHDAMLYEYVSMNIEDFANKQLDLTNTQVMHHKKNDTLKLKFNNSEFAVGSYYYYPANYKEAQIGGIFVGRTDGSPYKEEELKFLDSISNLFAIALNNKNSQAMLQSSEEKYRLLTESAKDMILLVNQTNILYANKATFDISGYDPEIIHEKNIKYFLPEKYSNWVDELIEARKNGSLMEVKAEIELKCADGRLLPVEFFSAPIIKNDSVTGFLIIARDISDRLINEQALINSEKKYRTLVENAFDGIFVFKENQIKYANPRFCDILGFTFNELVNSYRNATSIISSSSIDMIMPYISDLSIGSLYEQNIYIEAVHKDGHIVELELNTARIGTEGDYSVLGIVRDISERRKFERRMKRRDELLAAVSFSAETFLKKPDWQDCIAPILSKLRIASNTSRVTIFDCNRTTNGEAIGNLLFEEVADPRNSLLSNSAVQNYDIHKAGFGRFFELLVNKQIIYGNVEDFAPDECRIMKSLGLVSTVIAPIFAGKEFWGYIGFDDCENKFDKESVEIDMIMTAADIIGSAIRRRQVEQEVNVLNSELERRVVERTVQLSKTMNELRAEIEARKSIEEELVQTKDQILLAYNKEKELNELKSRFISMISHEYRTPLTIIMSSTYLLEKAIENSDPVFGLKHLDRVKVAVKQMTYILENVLVSGKMESQFAETNHNPFNLSESIYKLVEELNVIDKNEHNVAVYIESDYEVIIQDESFINVVLNNLLTNSIKYSKPGTKVEVIIRQLESMKLMLIVRDKGIGITDKDKKFIFTPFYRGENCGNTPGIGLGLSLVKTSVELMDGTVTFESLPDGGTEFVVTLPFKLPELVV